MKLRLSLRVRLTLIILLPLLLIAAGIGGWAFGDAQSRAADRFDRSLLSTALGISRDTAFSGGDALSEDTRDLLSDTSGGRVYYHVYAPDGVFVTGYARPPAPPSGLLLDSQPITYFEASYQDRAVRVVRLREWMLIDGLSGNFTFTVWQDLALRDSIVRSLTQRTNAVMASLMLALALIVWFGVRFGLSPLLDLEDAIERRSAKDLTPIKRRIPVEVSGIVGRLNTLLFELSQTLKAKDDFISDAAHQLRNPIAGVLALAEAAAGARTLEDAHERNADLIVAARHAAQLTEDLLAFERANTQQSKRGHAPTDMRELLRSLFPRLEALAQKEGIACGLDLADIPAIARVDRVLFEQAIINLVSNALLHGGDQLSQIDIGLKVERDTIRIYVRDDGAGLAQEDFSTALSRFAQVSPAEGSGLGLPIAKAIAESAGGTLSLSSPGRGLEVRMEFPCCDLD